MLCLAGRELAIFPGARARPSLPVGEPRYAWPDLLGPVLQRVVAPGQNEFPELPVAYRVTIEEETAYLPACATSVTKDDLNRARGHQRHLLPEQAPGRVSLGLADLRCHFLQKGEHVSVFIDHRFCHAL